MPITSTDRRGGPPTRPRWADSTTPTSMTRTTARPSRHTAMSRPLPHLTGQPPQPLSRQIFFMLLPTTYLPTYLSTYLPIYLPTYLPTSRMKEEKLSQRKISFSRASNFTASVQSKNFCGDSDSRFRDSFRRVKFEMDTSEKSQGDSVGVEQCDQIGRFIALWAIFRSLWQQLFCPNCPHFKAIFVRVSKIFHFSSEIIFGQL